MIDWIVHSTNEQDRRPLMVMSYHRNWLKPAARKGTPIAYDIIVASIFCIHISLLFLHSILHMRVFRPIFQLSKMTGTIPPARTAGTGATKKRAASPEVTVVDDVEVLKPKASDAKKPRLSTKTDDGTVSSSKVTVSASSNTISSKPTAPLKKLSAPTVKKAIFMPGCKSPVPSSLRS